MESKIGLFLWTVLLISNALIAASEDAPIVKLKQGELQGVLSKSRNGADFYAYWGIPYAKTPVRFQPPEPPTVPGWKGVRSATAPAPYCLQLNFFDRQVSGVEDCLFANVFTKSVDSQDKLNPVIVYIHPGAFMWSSGDTYGPNYFMDESVVLVTFNYRLSSLGFLNVAHFDGSSPSKPNLATGNMGLKDQTQLLKWVHENIKAFGGDPQRITLFGTSAGAASVTYHLLSPLSKGLFKHAIAASGTTLNSWAFVPNPNFYAKELGKAMDCPTSDSKDLVECLLKKDANEIIGKSYIAPTAGWPLDPITPFGPSIEKPNEKAGVFLSDHPETLLRKGKFQKVPFLTGVTKHEGLLLHAGGIFANDDLARALNQNWNQIAPTTLSLEGKVPESKWDEASEEIRVFYFGFKHGLVEDNEDGLEQMYSDRFFNHGVRTTVQYLAKETDVFPYVFDYWTTDSGFQNFYPKDYTGKVFHADDVLYGFSGSIFGQSLNPNNTESNEFSRKYVKLLVSFANNGAPDASVLGGTKWPKTSEEEATQKKHLQWFHVGKKPALERESFTYRMKFWDNLFKKYGSAGSREEL